MIPGPRPRSEQWLPVKEHNQPAAQQGVSVSPKERHRLAPSHGSTTTWRARCPDQSFQTRKSCEGDGRYSRTSRGGRQSRVDESQDSSEETVGGRRNKRVPKFITTAERRIKELDTERAKECTLLAEAQEHFERSVEEQSRCPAVMHGVSPDSGAQVTSPQQVFILLQSERGVLAKELQKARLEQPIQPVAKKQAIARQGTPPSRFSWSSSYDAQACAQRHDELVAGQSSRRPRRSCARRFHKPH